MSIGQKIAGAFFGSSIVLWVLIVITAIPAWITHIVVCIRDETFVLLLAGAIVFPVGVIHGWGCWFGWWA